jgi:hypothetical protein
VKRVTWQELRDICKLAGCVESRVKGDHLVMTKAGIARPVIIKMDRDMGEDIVRSNIRTLGLSRQEFEELLAKIRGYKH